MRVIFYQKEDGEKPAGKFIKSIQDQKLKAKMIREVKLLEQFGSSLGEPDSKPLRDGIFELRAIQSNNIARCLFFFIKGDKAIVTNGFIKKSKKTPPEEIDLAIRYRDDYYRRYGDE